MALIAGKKKHPSRRFFSANKNWWYRPKIFKKFFVIITLPPLKMGESKARGQRVIYLLKSPLIPLFCIFQSKLPPKPLECGHLNRSKKPPYRSVATREVYFYSISLVVVKFAYFFLSAWLYFVVFLAFSRSSININSNFNFSYSAWTSQFERDFF